MAGHSISQVHFVGSVCLPDTESTMRYLATSFRPNELKTIPDGEPKERRDFIIFQLGVFSKIPHVIQISDAPPQVDYEVPPGPDAPPIHLQPLGYDDFALESYATFCRLRDEGTVSPGTRFQVSLPTPVNVLGNLIRPAWRAALEPVYTAALLRALRRIQDSIPHEDLAIQWDMAGEIAFLEGAALDPPWFQGPMQDELVARAARMFDAVDRQVPVGAHLCYGDLGHKHFVEPEDLGCVVTVANALMRSTKRTIDWLHMPVPKTRSDHAYFAPLKQLAALKATVFLGLLHLDDDEGTKDKIAVAKQVLPRFGIATECGIGRSSKQELESAVRIAQQVLRAPSG